MLISNRPKSENRFSILIERTFKCEQQLEIDVHHMKKES